MSEYTKGEWEIKEETDGHFGVYPQDAESCIAVVWSGENQAEANARLIAAAPKQNAALHKIMKLADRAIRASDGKRGTIINEIGNTAETVIAEAEKDKT